MKQSQTSRMVSYVIVLLMLALYVFPLFYLFNVSMKTQTEYLLDPVALTEGIRLENFSKHGTRELLSVYVEQCALYRDVHPADVDFIYICCIPARTQIC